MVRRLWVEPELGGGPPGGAGVTAAGKVDCSESGGGATSDPAESGVSLVHGESEGRVLMVNVSCVAAAEATRLGAFRR